MRGKAIFLWLIFSILYSGCLSRNLIQPATFTTTPTSPEITIQPPIPTSTPSPIHTRLPSLTATSTSTPTPSSIPSPTPMLDNPFSAFCENPQTLGDLKDARIAFIADWDGKMKIYSIHPDGSGLVKISGRQAVDGWPVAWSPDGKRIAFAIPDTYADQFIVEPRPPGQGQLFIMNVDGTGGFIPAPELPIIPEAEIAWSPDSQRLAFGGILSGKTETFLYAMQADGSDQMQLTDSNVGFAFGWASWSSDGKRVAYAQVYDRYGHTYLGIGASDYKHYQLINFPFEYDTLENPGWSPVDPNLLLFQANKLGCGNQLFMKNMQTGDQVEVTACGDYNERYKWSPDGNIFSYLTSINDVATLSLYHLFNNTSEILLPDLSRYIEYMTWSPDSHWIAFTMWEKDKITSEEGFVDLYIVNVCDSSSHLVAKKIPMKFDIFWVP